jgi:hypothetical protein
LIDAYLNGQFCNLTSGTIYTSYDRKRCNSNETIKEREPLFIGQDFNVGDYTDTLKATRYAVDYEIKPESEADICPNMAGSQTSFPKNKAFNEKGECVDAPKAFSEVVLSQFGRDDKEATFTISLKFDPIIFSDKNKVNLLVPAGDTTDQINVFEVEN